MGFLALSTVGSALLVAAIQKGRRFATFETYLVPILGRCARFVGAVTIVVEAGIGLAWLAQAAGFFSGGWVGAGASAFIATATIGYAARLVAARGSTCACFGGGGSRSSSIRWPLGADFAFRPAAVVLRNIGLCLVGFVAYRFNVGAIIGVSAVLAGSVGVGLVGSMLRERSYIRRPIHPRYAVIEFSGRRMVLGQA